MHTQSPLTCTPMTNYKLGCFYRGLHTTVTNTFTHQQADATSFQRRDSAENEVACDLLCLSIMNELAVAILLKGWIYPHQLSLSWSQPGPSLLSCDIYNLQSPKKIQSLNKCMFFSDELKWRFWMHLAESWNWNQKYILYDNQLIIELYLIINTQIKKSLGCFGIFIRTINSQYVNNIHSKKQLVNS